MKAPYLPLEAEQPTLWLLQPKSLAGTLGKRGLEVVITRILQRKEDPPYWWIGKPPYCKPPYCSQGCSLPP